MKRILLLLMMILICLFSCTSERKKESEILFQDTSSVHETIGQAQFTSEPDVGTYTDINAIETVTEPDAITLIRGIDTVEYIDPDRVSECANMPEDQRLAFAALCDALNDILKNGPTPDKRYALPGKMEWLDYKSAFNLLRENYTAAENIISNILYEDIGDTASGEKYCETFYLWGYEVELLKDEYTKFLEIDRKADEILSSLEHDGTDYGKAHSIAQWMVDHIAYAYDHEGQPAAQHNTAHIALTKNEAVCDGYAKAFDFLCKKAGLESIYVSAKNLSHAWNMIRINGKWYHVDVTWMDHEGMFYQYFMMSDEICRITGHSKWVYHWDQKNNLDISPIADSDDLYMGH